uniref:Uncharacterized protein n=1 Tax=Anguilla anguilla TaxID=7936 RepID=A0A0E9PT36_ANGAN
MTAMVVSTVIIRCQQRPTLRILSSKTHNCSDSS